MRFKMFCVLEKAQQCRIKHFKSDVWKSFFRAYAKQYSRDPYDVLQIKRGADKKEIKRAYIELSKKYHPDINKSDPQAKQKFVEISNAYSDLTDNKQNVQRDRQKAYQQSRQFYDDQYRQYRQQQYRQQQDFYHFHQNQHSYNSDPFEEWKKYETKRRHHLLAQSRILLAVFIVFVLTRFSLFMASYVGNIKYDREMEDAIKKYELSQDLYGRHMYDKETGRRKRVPYYDDDVLKEYRYRHYALNDKDR